MKQSKIIKPKEYLESNLTNTQTEGGSQTIDSAGLEKLKDSITGNVLTEGLDGYDDARTIWNVMIDHNRR